MSLYEPSPRASRAALPLFYVLLAALLVLWGLAVATWGAVALTVPALVLVPVVMVTLILLTVGR